MIATEQEVVTLNDVAKPLTNYKEMMAAAATRRNIHRETAEVLKRGLQPQPTSEDTEFDPAKAPDHRHHCVGSQGMRFAIS